MEITFFNENTQLFSPCIVKSIGKKCYYKILLYAKCDSWNLYINNDRNESKKNLYKSK